MVLVDTSVWIDFFQSHLSPYTQTLEGLIKDRNRSAICGIILQEILQGIRDRRSYLLTKESLIKLPFVDTSKDTYVFASSLYRTLRGRGRTVPPADATIAALAISNKIPLLTLDLEALYLRIEEKMPDSCLQLHSIVGN